MDERLESSWRLVYYQVSGEPGIARCVVNIRHSPYSLIIESSWHLVYYQVSGEPGIAHCVIDIGHSPHGVWTCAQAYSLIIAA